MGNGADCGAGFQIVGFVVRKLTG